MSEHFPNAEHFSSPDPEVQEVVEEVAHAQHELEKWQKVHTQATEDYVAAVKDEATKPEVLAALQKSRDDAAEMMQKYKNIIAYGTADIRESDTPEHGSSALH